MTRFSSHRAVFFDVVLLFVIVAAGGANPAAASEPITMLSPLATDTPRQGTRLNQSMKTPSDDATAETFVTRTGRVRLSLDDLNAPPGDQTVPGAKLQRSWAGSEMALSFFPSQDYRIVVDHEALQQGSARIIRGTQKDFQFSTFSLTITDDQYVLTFQDLENNMLYKVVGASDTGQGDVTEIDLGRIPPVRDLDAVVPPRE